MAQRLDITNIDLDEIHVSGLGQDTGTQVSLNDADVRLFGNNQGDSTYSGGSVSLGANTEISLGEFRNAELPEFFNTGTNGMVAKTGYGNASAYFSGFVQTGHSRGGLFNYTSGSTYNNDFEGNATLFGKVDNLLLNVLRNGTSFSGINATPTSGDVILTIGGNYLSSVGALGTNFGAIPDLSVEGAYGEWIEIIENASAHFSNTGWTRLVLTPSGGSTVYLNRADAAFTATSQSDSTTYLQQGTLIYGAVSYTWSTKDFTDFFGSPYTSGLEPYQTTNTYNWSVHME